MTRPAVSRPIRRIAACLVGGALWAGPAAAQGFLPFVGFSPLPTFAWPRPDGDAESRWTGSYAALSTGFAVSTSKRLGSYAGPTLGFEGGRIWQEGPLLWGIVGGFDALAPVGGNLTPGFGRLAYTRDLAGALHLQVGTLVTPDVLVYAKAGGWAVHETLRVGPSPAAQAFSRTDLAVRPDARVGVEWAVTDRLSVAVEAGVVGGGIR